MEHHFWNLDPCTGGWEQSLRRWAAREALRCRNFDKAGNPMEQAHCIIDFVNVLFSWCDNIPQTDCQHPVWGARYPRVIMLVCAPSSLSCPPSVTSCHSNTPLPVLLAYSTVTSSDGTCLQQPPQHPTCLAELALRAFAKAPHMGYLPFLELVGAISLFHLHASLHSVIPSLHQRDDHKTLFKII